MEETKEKKDENKSDENKTEETTPNVKSGDRSDVAIEEDSNGNVKDEKNTSTNHSEATPNDSTHKNNSTDNKEVSKQNKKKGKSKSYIKIPSKSKMFLIALFALFFGYIGSLSDGKTTEVANFIKYGTAKEMYTFNDWLNLTILMVACLIGVVFLKETKKGSRKQDSAVSDSTVSDSAVSDSAISDNQPSDNGSDKSIPNDKGGSQQKGSINSGASVEDIFDRYNNDNNNSVEDNVNNNDFKTENSKEEFNSLGIDLDDLLSGLGESSKDENPNEKNKDVIEMKTTGIDSLEPF